ncbi:hypothetical protein HK097_010269 [Rhizophlyctis rosea]|uniref:Uncharacterized protein n=1 Tax=Rhizophlyctis rosea TaxID=64517 RepID=A0AAD5S9G1_9FUNG|nr:hypothetical protein HK097_010269 [Rhizophlyctis rosea]
MSLKGLQKAVARLPQRIAARTGYSDETVDTEYLELESQFKNLELYAKKLHDDARKFKDSLSAMLAHQATFAETLVDVYKPVTTARYGGGSPGGATTSGDELEEDSPLGRTNTVSSLGSSGRGSKETPHPQSLHAAETFSQSMIAIRESLQPDLDTIERRVIAPTKDYLLLIDLIKRFILKRQNKLVDYDRHRVAVAKLKAKPDRTVGDEKTLGKMETQFDQAAREYNNINNLLKSQLPTFLALRIQFMDPCFQTLYYYQYRCTQAVLTALKELAQQNSIDTRVAPQDSFARKELQMTEMLASLAIVKRPLRPDEGESAEGYGPSDTSPTDHHPASSVTGTEQLPSYEEAGGSRINPNIGFASVHQSSMPSAGPSKPPGGGGGAVGGGKYVVALYDFEAQAEGDLSFSRDDKIEIVQRTADVNDWWTGRVGGRTGQFPGNYVAEL